MPALPRLFLLSSLMLSSLMLAVIGDAATDESAPARRLTPLKPHTRHPLKAQTDHDTRRGVIPELLVARACQSGYGACSTGGCCKIGGQCCSNGGCCDPGEWCYSTFCCLRSQGGCDQRGCCNLSENCCKGGTCCSSGDYCAVDELGNQGCCPNGKVCSGSSNQCDSSGYVPCANDDFCCLPGQTCYRDSDNNPRCRAGGSTLTTKITTTTHTTTKATPTTAPETTTTADESGTTHSTTSTGIQTGPTTAPTAPAGSQNIIVDVSEDTSIAWTGDWVVVASTCTPGSKAKSCSGDSSSIADGTMMYSFKGTSIYLSIASNNAQYVIALDEEETDYGSPFNSIQVPSNCTFGWMRTNLSATTTHSLFITIIGASNGDSRRDIDGPWSLEIQNLVVTQPTSSSGLPSGVSSGASTASAKAGAGGDDSPSGAAPTAIPAALALLAILAATAFVYM
ncbi:hypothetical protein FB451DRAFT_1273228 [Mycena latifolia]|nr:hypothetical protein FB451DRAFT_1273228 [Mycena latifolia]